MSGNRPVSPRNGVPLPEGRRFTAGEVREQKLREAQDISEALLDAEVRIGELMAKAGRSSK